MKEEEQREFGWVVQPATRNRWGWGKKLARANFPVVGVAKKPEDTNV